jgi:integrase
LNVADNTKEAYIQGMQAYLSFMMMTPEELIGEVEGEIRLGILARHRKIKKHLIAFRKHLQDRGLADFTVRSRMTGVISFYNFFEIEFPKLQGDTRKARVLDGNKAVPKKEDLQEVLKVCDPLEKAVMLVGVASGLASNDIRNLTIKQFKYGYDKETGITTLPITREKTGVEFITFLSQETSKAVWEYLV